MRAYKTIFFGLIMLFQLKGVVAQHIYLNVNGGYLFGDKFSIQGGKARIYGDWSFSGTAGLEIGKGRSAEISYLWQQTRGKTSLAFPQNDLDESIHIHYILLGASQFSNLGEGFSMGGSGKIGIMVLSPFNPDLDDLVKFAVGLEGGMRYMFNPGMGVKLSANVFFPLLDVGSFLWWSSGGGTQVGVNSSIPFAQFGLFGGIIVKPAQLMD